MGADYCTVFSVVLLGASVLVTGRARDLSSGRTQSLGGAPPFGASGGSHCSEEQSDRLRGISLLMTARVAEKGERQMACLHAGSSLAASCDLDVCARQHSTGQFRLLKGGGAAAC